MKNLFSIVSSFILLVLNNYSSQAQTYSLELEMDSIGYINKVVCYKIGVTNTGDQNFYLAGQNYRLFYDSEKIEFIEISGSSCLPTGIYTPFELVNTVKNVNATGTGDLPFEDNLGFINGYIDLNDTQNGGLFIEPDSTLYSARLCFEILDKSLEVACFDITLANEEETSDYATAFNEISVWNGPNNTGAAIGDEYFNIYADTLSDCVDFVENSFLECNDGIDNDGNGFIDCDDMSCSKPAITNIQILNPTQASCPDGDNGSIVIISSNTTRFSKDGGINWQSNGSFTDLKGESYNLQLINDATGCFSDTTITLIPVLCDEICNDGIDNDGNGLIDCEDMSCGKPAITNIQIINPTQASCPDGDNGSMTITSDNTTRYSNDGGITLQSNGIFTDLVGRTYNIQLINDATGCITDTTVTLPPILCNEICNDGIDNDGNGFIDCEDISCGRPSITNILITNPTQTSCPYGDNGSMIITSDNTTRYSDDGGITWQSNEIFTELTGGTFPIQVINDVTGCTSDTMVILTSILCNEICNDGIDNDGNGLIDCEEDICNCENKLKDIVYPNIFSPTNNDGINDLLYIHINTNIFENFVDIEIYNRWGNLIHIGKNQDIANLWNGKQTQGGSQVVQGVYIVKISMFEKNSKDKIIKIFSLTLI
ncbi:MAG TPA: gliding motility-associated C-terminal domain-containing protein [Saprospiraceae bacterium]|nr:gliding motility-associated C-terminal domain-containing protein [Saprospiraceae bacterium]